MILRPRWFMQNFGESFFLPPILQRRELPAPAGGAVSFIDARDIYTVEARALTEDGHAGAEYALTGGRALTFAEVAEIIGDASGREVRHVDVTSQEMRRKIPGAGFPDDYADMLLGLFEAIRAGWGAPVAKTVARVLGRPLIGFAEFACDHAEAWRGA